MSDFYNKYPYTDFHELNLDWVIERVKKLTEDWASTLEEWNSTEEQWQELYDYVHDYFDNLDVQEEINNKIDAMISDGTLITILTPTISSVVSNNLPSVVADQIDNTVASQIGSVVANQIDDAVLAEMPNVAPAVITNWMNDNITQPTTPVVDTSLTVSGAAADSQVTGNRIGDLTDALNSKNIDALHTEYVLSEDNTNIVTLGRLITGYYVPYNGYTPLAVATYGYTIVPIFADTKYHLDINGVTGSIHIAYFTKLGMSSSTYITGTFTSANIDVTTPATAKYMAISWTYGSGTPIFNKTYTGLTKIKDELINIIKPDQTSFFLFEDNTDLLTLLPAIQDQYIQYNTGTIASAANYRYVYVPVIPSRYNVPRLSEEDAELAMMENIPDKPFEIS